MIQHKPVIAVTTAYFEPGIRGGGSTRSLINLALHLQEEFDFRFICGDREPDGQTLYKNIATDHWTQFRQFPTIYISRSRQGFWRLLQVLRELPFDLLYLNSFFSPRFAIQLLLLRRCGVIQSAPMIIAPRGEFSSGALQIKSWKKRPYIVAAKLFGLTRRVWWQASSEFEAQDIKNTWGEHAKILVASDLPPPNTAVGISGHGGYRGKEPGYLRIVFCARIAPIKNLEFIFDCLAQVSGNITFDIFGPISDIGYWQTIQAKMLSLPASIKVTYRGEVAPDEVIAMISGYHLLFLPSKGENYCHSILEALMAGCPVLVSDRTPWRNLAEKMAGWDLPLEHPSLFCDILQQLVAMREEQYYSLQEGAFQLAQAEIANPAHARQNIAMFRQVLEECSQ